MVPRGRRTYGRIYGQTPADFIVSDNDSEGEDTVDIQDSDGDYFPNVTENTHYATKQYRKFYLRSKSRFELAQSRSPLLSLTLVQNQRRRQTRIPRMISSLTLAAPSLRMSLMALTGRMSSTAPKTRNNPIQT
jgi:hypothetical protein